MTARPFGKEYINKVDIPKRGIVEVEGEKISVLYTFISDNSIECECIEDSKIGKCGDVFETHYKSLIV